MLKQESHDKRWGLTPSGESSILESRFNDEMTKTPTGDLQEKIRSFLGHKVTIAISSFVLGSVIWPVAKEHVLLRAQQLIRNGPLTIKCNTRVVEFVDEKTGKEEGLNVRTGDSKYHATIGKPLPDGTPIEVIDVSNGWLQISKPIQGYVAENRTNIEIDCPVLAHKRTN